MHVERLNHAHLEAYRELMLEAYAQAPDAFTSTPEERAAQPTAWWRERLLEASFGAFDGQALVGTVTLECAERTKTRHKAHLVGMYLRPAARGRGAARMLMDAALAHARGLHHLSLVTLTVTQGNEAATALYRAAGFEAFGLEPMAILTPQGYRAKLHMALRLDGRPLDAPPPAASIRAPGAPVRALG